MEKLDYLYDLVDRSSVSVLGYTYKTERIKDEFISRLPHLSVGEIDSSFNFVTYLREIKLTQILEDSPDFKYVVIDIGDVRHSSSSTSIEFSRSIGKMIEKIRQDMFKAYNKIQEESFGLDFDDPESHKEEAPIETPYKLIVTTPMYKAPRNSDGYEIDNFMGGHFTLYMADLAFTIQDSGIVDKLLGKKPYISIVKNRYDGDNINVSIDEILSTLERDSKLEKVLN
jgi:hypothetical protein